MAKRLKARGFKFVGPTICYAFMQATGLVNDHLTSCFRHREVKRPAASKRRKVASRRTSSLRSRRGET
jgi:hypothetical protein